MEETYCRSTMQGLELDTRTLEKPHLIMLSGESPLRTVFIEDERMRLGRDPARNDLVLTSRRVSGAHCLIVRKENGFQIEDLDSSNGTWVNGRQLLANQPVQLAHGDKIVVADQMLLFLWQGSHETSLDATAIRIDRDEVRHEAERLLQEIPGIAHQRPSKSAEGQGDTGV